MILSKKEALAVLDGDNEDYTIISDEIVGQRRWSTSYELIVKNKDGNFYIAWYDKGSTESQDESPWESDKQVIFNEAEEYSETVTKYRVKKV